MSDVEPELPRSHSEQQFEQLCVLLVGHDPAKCDQILRLVKRYYGEGRAEALAMVKVAAMRARMAQGELDWLLK